MVAVAGEDKPKPVYPGAPCPTAPSREMVELRRIGLMSTMIPSAPTERPGVDRARAIELREPVREFRLATENYTELAGKFDFGRYLWNTCSSPSSRRSITLLFNAMAAFALRSTGSPAARWCSC